MFEQRQTHEYNIVEIKSCDIESKGCYFCRGVSDYDVKITFEGFISWG